MFQNLVNFFKGKDFLASVLDEFNVMLTNSEEMFNLVCKKLIHNEGAEDLREKVYSLDKTVNTKEKVIRKKIVGHLNMQPSVDVTACLLLMSVVKDAERLGDYCKNLYEVEEFIEGSFPKDKYAAWFNEMDEKIAKLFKETKEAFMESDVEKAKHSWAVKEGIGKECDQIIEKLAKTKDLSVNEAVCFTLIARHFKRLSSHLINISTSVVLPIDKLDYFDEKLTS